MRTVDKTKKSNIKCEHCKHWTNINQSVFKCSITHQPKNYYNRCKQFEWKDKYLQEVQE